LPQTSQTAWQCAHPLYHWAFDFCDPCRQRQAKADADIQELSSLRAATVKLGANQGGNFSSIDTATVAGLSFFNANRVSGSGATTSVMNQWKGTISVAPASIASASSNDALAFTYTGVPTDACKEVVQSAAQIAAVISIGGTTVKSNGGTLSVANMITQCNAGADNTSIVYTMSR
jgi:PilS N terminal